MQTHPESLSLLSPRKVKRNSEAEQRRKQMCPEWPHGPCEFYRTDGYSDEPLCIHADMEGCTCTSNC